MTLVDVVVVSYNSLDELRVCVEPLSRLEDVNVIVVDNASSDGSLESVTDLPVTAIALGANGGFAHGCNEGWRAGGSPYVLLLNPDARIDAISLRTLAAVLDADPTVGAVAPRIVDAAGELDHSQRREPRLRSTYAQAFFLHRLFPRAGWTDELVRDPVAYERPGSPEWVSGAALMLRRDVLAELDGLDEGFFMYGEDIDLCRRLRAAGHGLRFEPAATVVHAGGASAPRPALLPVLASSRLRYAAKHRGRTVAALERLGIALGAATHALVGRGGLSERRGHARALRLALSHRPQN